MNANDFLTHLNFWVDIDMQFFTGKTSINHLNDTDLNDTVTILRFKPCGLSIENQLPIGSPFVFGDG